MLIFLAVIATPLVCQSVGQSYNTMLKIQCMKYNAWNIMHYVHCIGYDAWNTMHRI